MTLNKRIEWKVRYDAWKESVKNVDEANVDGFSI